MEIRSTQDGGAGFLSCPGIPEVPSMGQDVTDSLTDALLAPTGALVVMMVYYISARSGNFFRFSLSPLMQLMLQVSL